MDNATQKYIGDTNNLIEAMLEVLLPDFMAITKFLKDVNGMIKGCDARVVDAHSQIVRELQYYDTLTQKMQHIVKVHELIISENSTSNGEVAATGVSMIRLNHLQFQVACFEYLSSVNHIQTNLSICMACDTFPKVKVESVFQYSGILLTASRRINEHFVNLERMCYGSNVDLLSKVGTISKIYSMESERSILHAYIHKPQINDAEIESVPVTTPNQSDIDLF